MLPLQQYIFNQFKTGPFFFYLFFLVHTGFKAITILAIQNIFSSFFSMILRALFLCHFYVIIFFLQYQGKCKH